MILSWNLLFSCILFSYLWCFSTLVINTRTQVRYTSRFMCLLVQTVWDSNSEAGLLGFWLCYQILSTIGTSNVAQCWRFYGVGKIAMCISLLVFSYCLYWRLWQKLEAQDAFYVKSVCCAHIVGIALFVCTRRVSKGELEWYTILAHQRTLCHVCAAWVTNMLSDEYYCCTCITWILPSNIRPTRHLSIVTDEVCLL